MAVLLNVIVGGGCVQMAADSMAPLSRLVCEAVAERGDFDNKWFVPAWDLRDDRGTLLDCRLPVADYDLKDGAIVYVHWHVDEAVAERDQARAEVERLKAERGTYMAALANARDDFRKPLDVYEAENAALRDKLERAEAVCKEIDGSIACDIVGEDAVKALESWREGKDK